MELMDNDGWLADAKWIPFAIARTAMYLISKLRILAVPSSSGALSRVRGRGVRLRSAGRTCAK